MLASFPVSVFPCSFSKYVWPTQSAAANEYHKSVWKSVQIEKGHMQVVANPRST